MKRIARIVSVFAGTLVYLGLAMLGRGGVTAFVAEPALVALALVMIALTVAALFTEGNLSTGVREDRGNRWILIPLIGLGFVGAYLPAWSDRAEIWVIGGDGVRWLGVVLAAFGGILRLAPVFILGRRFSGLVAIQPDHRLVTDGLYGIIRHPSYLGLLVTQLGWGLAFRSGIGVLIAVLMIPPILIRIAAEERLLHGEFGAAYDAYRARTSRLIPGLY